MRTKPRPGETNALRVLVARREAGDDIFGEDELAHVQRDRERAMDPRGFATHHGFPMNAIGGPSEQKQRREARLLEERMADAADVTGVAWEDARAAGDADNQRKLERIQRRHHSEQRALEGTAHTAQSGRGVVASANLGGPQGRARSPVTQQRTLHVDTLVDPGCNQHLFEDPDLFVTVDRGWVMQPFTVASDRTATPLGFGTAQFGATNETGSRLTVTLPGCSLDETLPFSLLSVSQLIESGTISHPDFTRRELHFLDCPGFLDADPQPRTIPMNSEGGLYSLRLTPQLRLITQANSGGPPPPGTKLKEPMQVLAGVRDTVD
jgi:hypothetical protein